MRSSGHSFVENFPLLAWRTQYWRLMAPLLRTAGHLAKGYHHGVGGIGPAQVGQVLELDVAPATRSTSLRSGAPIAARFLPPAEKVGRV
jgi:hypothetical protein